MRARARILSHPIHPILITFPLALWISSFVFDLLGTELSRAPLWGAGFYAVAGGCVGAVLAAAAGAIDLFTVVPPNSTGRTRGLQHAALNVVALLLFAFITWRRGGPEFRPDAISLLFSGVGVGIVGMSGWLGGTLVYRNQIGIDHRYANAGKWRERTLRDWDKPVCKKDDLEPGQMMLVHVNAERIVVGRCDEGYFAFSNHCTHRGGPLADGALVGCVVQCPWHGSQFDVRNGHAEAGPAKQKIDLYRCEIRKNDVFIVPKRK